MAGNRLSVVAGEFSKENIDRGALSSACLRLSRIYLHSRDALHGNREETTHGGGMEREKQEKQ